MDTYERFKRLYPNSTAQNTPQNIPRFEWAIANYKPSGGLELSEQIPQWVTDLRKARQVTHFNEFNPICKLVYLQLADVFAGVQIYATGSRVNGTYVTEGSSEKVKEMRGILGIPPKDVSDFDFTVDYEGSAADVHKLAVQADVICSGRFAVRIDFSPFIKGQPKIKVPMWDFTKLTDEQKKEARKLVEAKNWDALRKIHNDAKLSQNVYCCDVSPIAWWFTWAYNEGHLGE